MNARSSSSASPRARTTTAANLAFQPSTAGWYAEWKARKSSAAAPPQPAEPASTPAPSDDAAEAVARWLTGGAEK